jgi:hypothetical protein
MKFWCKNDYCSEPCSLDLFSYVKSRCLILLMNERDSHLLVYDYKLKNILNCAYSKIGEILGSPPKYAERTES